MLEEFGLVSPIFKAETNEPRKVSLEFTGGTVCDLHGSNRSTTVDIFCGPALVFASVVEDATCHYRIVIESPSACMLPGFLPPKENTTVIFMQPLHDAVSNHKMK